MNWTVFLVVIFCFISSCGVLGDYEDCVCDGDTENRCTCDLNEDGYEERVVIVVIVAILTLGVAVIIVGCCLHQRKLRNKRIKEDKERLKIEDQPIQYVLPPLMVGVSPNYTTLPYYHPGAHDSSILPPSPYTIT